MHIIFNTENINEIKSNNVLLELDTFYFSNLDQTTTAYCVIENIKIDDFDKILNLTNLHDQLMTSYKNQKFKLCLDLIDNLTGSFGGELDSFYHELVQRIQSLLSTQLADNWTPVISRND